MGSPITGSSVSASLSGGAGASGTLTFTVFGPQSSAPTSCTSGGATIGTASVSGEGSYRPSAGFTTLTAGDYWWYASYDGDANNSAAGSTCGAAMAETIVGTASPSLSASALGSGVAGSPIAGSSVSATLSGGSAASGTLTFTVFGPQSSAPTSCTSGGTTIGTASVSGDGSYHPSAGYTPTTAGDYWWYASYDGDPNNNAAGSTCGAAMAETIATVVRTPTPSNVSPPTIAGTARQNQTLTESHGIWTNIPTGYAYQWYDCDRWGSRCVAITGATWQKHVLGSRDVGHTIRVAERAYNASGYSAPALSPATALAAALPLPHTNITTVRIDKKHRNAKFAFSAAGASGFQCALTRATRAKAPKLHYSNCSSPKFYKHLKPGSYSFEVKALRGNQASTPTSNKFRI